MEQLLNQTFSLVKSNLKSNFYLKPDVGFLRHNIPEVFIKIRNDLTDIIVTGLNLSQCHIGHTTTYI